MRDKSWLTSYPVGVPTEITVSHATIVEMFDESCQAFAERIAYSNMGSQLTFAQLHQKVDVFASFLQHDLQLKKGERLAIMLPNLLQHPVVMYAALKVGLVVVNVNPLYTADELVFQLQDTATETLVVLSNFAHIAEQALARVPIKNIIVTQVGDLLSQPKGWLVNGVLKYVKKAVPVWQIDGALMFKQALKLGAKRPFEAVAVNEDDIAFLQPTSGTTGMPKSAMLLHRNMMANMEQISAWISGNFTDQEIIITALPLYHVFSLCVNGLAMIKKGVHSVLITNPRDISSLINTLKSIRFTVMTGVNTLYNALLHHKQFASIDFSHLHTAVAGGMALQESVATLWHEKTGIWMIEGYGVTECSPVVSVNPLGLDRHSMGIGLPLPSTDVEMRDEQGNAVAIGEAGELCVKGPQVMFGYWQKEEETKATFFADGWLRTGDIGKMDEQGFCYIVDRKKNMIIVSGFNVYPNEVENVLTQMPGILEAAVIGVPCGSAGEKVKAFIVREDKGLLEKSVIDFCRQHLTAYKVPKMITFCEQLPKNPVGKILHRVLREAENKQST